MSEITKNGHSSPVASNEASVTPTPNSPNSEVAKNCENRSPEYHKLIDYGLHEKVAARLEEIYKTGKLLHSDLDQRALDALKEFPPDGALGVLSQFLESNLAHVSNKSAYLCGVMKTYRVKSRSSSNSIPNGVNSSGSNSSNGGNQSNGGLVAKGPDEAKIQEILKRTGYKLDVTTGQRKYGGPPPNWEGEEPVSGCEVFCGKIPRDMYESELIPLFEKCGTIWDLRLMMDPMTGLNRGYAFVTFTTRDAAQEAVRQLDSYEISEGKELKVNVSEPKTRLFLGNIPKSKGKDDIEEELVKLTAGLREVIIYSSPDDKKKNRGFCFLEYESHKAASLAKRRLETGRIKVWSCDIIVDWADPQEEPDEETMNQVKVLYVRNLTSAVTEDKIQEVFEEFGKIERVKKIKDYAFVHFEDRDKACDAMKALNHKDLAGAELDISLAKPPSDKKKKEEMLRKREQRMMRAITNNEVAFRLSNMHMAVPPSFLYPAAYPLPVPDLGIYPRGGGHAHPGNQNRGQNSNRGNSGSGGGRNSNGHWPQWHQNGGWSGDGNWSQRGHVPWMAAAGAELWGHPNRNSGGNNYNWANGNGGQNRGRGKNFNSASNR